MPRQDQTTARTRRRQLHVHDNCTQDNCTSTFSKPHHAVWYPYADEVRRRSTYQTCAVIDSLCRLIHEFNKDRDARFLAFVSYDEDDQFWRRRELENSETEKIDYMLYPSVASSTYDPSRQLPQTYDEQQAAELVKCKQGCDLSLLLGDDICITRLTNWSQQIAGKFKDVYVEMLEEFSDAMVEVLEESTPSWPCFLAGDS
ncbi:hypothetical protein R1sor_000739 [Riccia sorocarpa]|uniref:Uncharacterized protein n=1 Tax=Riccia sorocarpa TaxID=122646 RepID=A0ABD3GX23_9MARC